MDQKRPSKKQQILLSFIDGFIKGNGYGPSYREIMRALDYKSVSTVATHVDGLIACGLLVKKDNSARSLEVITAPSPEPSTTQQISGKEKWLSGEITKRLDSLKGSHTEKKVEDLYVLIGTLKILGFTDSHQLHQTALETYLNNRRAA